MNSCGYTPMYSSAIKTDFYLEKINLNGDEFIIKNVTNNFPIGYTSINSKTMFQIGPLISEKNSNLQNFLDHLDLKQNLRKHQ